MLNPYPKSRGAHGARRGLTSRAGFPPFPLGVGVFFLPLGMMLALVTAAPAFAAATTWGATSGAYLAQAPSDPAGVVEVGEPVIRPPESGPALDVSTQQLLQLVSLLGGAVKAGAWFTAAVLLIMLVVLCLRLYGKKLHEWIADTNPLDKPLWFLFDTKPGGVLLNGLTTCCLVLLPLVMLGGHLTPAAAGAALLAGIGASQVYGWGKDLVEWWAARKVPSPAPAQAAGLEAAKDPGPTING